MGMQKYNKRFREALRTKLGRVHVCLCGWEHVLPGHQLVVAQRLWNSTGFGYAESPIYEYIRWTLTDGNKAWPWKQDCQIHQNEALLGGQRRGQQEGWEVQNPS